MSLALKPLIEKIFICFSFILAYNERSCVELVNVETRVGASARIDWLGG